MMVMMKLTISGRNKRCYSCKWRKTLASLGYVVTSSFVATNNEDFKILKDMVDFYLQYKKTRNTM
jgi:hypothetical protein